MVKKHRTAFFAEKANLMALEPFIVIGGDRCLHWLESRKLKGSVVDSQSLNREKWVSTQRGVCVAGAVWQ